MKEGIKEALAKLNATRAKAQSSEAKGPPTESGEIPGTVRIGNEIKYLQEPKG